MNIKEELKKDFEKSLEKIDFNSYNPSSKEFQSTLDIALMLYLLTKLKFDEKLEYKDTDWKSDDNLENESNDKISEEISNAKKYFQKYLDNGDEMYKNMALDEIKHANFFLKKAYSKLPNAEEKNKLKSYEVKINEISSELNKD